MKRFLTTMLTASLLLSHAAIAQDGPPGFGPPGGFPGPGGSGFGPPMGGPDSGVALLGMSEVQDELKLSGEQKKSIIDVSQKLQQSIRAIFESGGPAAGEVPPAEGGNRFEQMIGKIQGLAAKADENAKAVLDDKQAKRYSQLRLQRGGSAALVRDDVSKQLKLSEEQVEKIRELQAGDNPFLSPEDRDRMNKDSMAVLSDEQRTLLAELKGPEFKFSELMFGGPGGFGGGFPGGPGEMFGGGPPGMGGPGGPGGMMGQGRKLVEQFDKDDNGWLNKEERAAAQKDMQTNGVGRRGGFGPFGGFGGREEPVSAGPKMVPSDVKASDAPFYDPATVRTLFLSFEGDDWESELEAFNNTDVEVPATLMADGQTYENVGVHFRGMSSFGMVQAGHKRSLNLSLDFLNEDQKIGGYKTLNLLNAHEDASFMHTVLYFDIARNYLPAPKANFVQVVINGESWGLYVSAQQFNKEFVKENFGSSKGTRWKVPGSPMGRGGLEYLGDDVSAYERVYSVRSSSEEKAWKKLIAFCKTLNETPADKLEEALTPILDIDEVLWFLALENALINSDGYWARASDYCIFLDSDNKFHIIPHDANETFQPAMGPGIGGPGMGRGGFGGGGRGQRPQGEGEPGGGQQRESGRGRGPGGGGFGGGMGSGGVMLDPLVGMNDASKPLRSKLLAVPKLKQRYLSFVKTIAEDWLDWNKLSPVVDSYACLIGPYIEADTRKLSSYEGFRTAVSAEARPVESGRPAEGGPGFGPFGGGPRMSLREFADQRRAFLLEHPEVKAATRVDYKRPEVKAKTHQEKTE